MSGTVIEALYDQQLELDRDRDIMNTMLRMLETSLYNEAIQKRADADLARWRGKVAKKASYYAAGAKFIRSWNKSYDSLGETIWQLNYINHN